LTFIWLQHLRRERDDPHEPLVAQFAADRAEDAGPARLAVVLDDDRGVLLTTSPRLTPDAGMASFTVATMTSPIPA